MRNSDRLFAADSSIKDNNSIVGRVVAWLLILTLIAFGIVLWVDEDKRNQVFAYVQTQLEEWFPEEKAPSVEAITTTPPDGKMEQLSEEITQLEQDPAVLYPIPSGPAAAAKSPAKLPPLTRSDPVINKELNRLIRDKTLRKLLANKFIIERFVITIDSLTRKKIPFRQKFYNSPTGQLQVYSDDSGAIYLDPKNHARYRQFIHLAESVDIEQLVAVYRTYYPLFQQAYEELGYPNKYFNDRLIEIIDHVLEPPAAKHPLKLKRPGVYYMYANPDLERRSAGQKILIRMGNDNATRLKTQLRKIHGLLLASQ